MKILWGRVATSKTVIIGILMMLAAIVEYIAGLPPEASIGQVVSGIIMVAIRFLTNDAVIERK